VRKRLVPFFIAKDATSSFVDTAGLFGPISSEIKQRCMSQLSSIAPDAAAECEIAVGDAVFPVASSTSSSAKKAVGEIIHLDRSRSMGVALMQSAVLLHPSGSGAGGAEVPGVQGGGDAIPVERGLPTASIANFEVRKSAKSASSEDSADGSSVVAGAGAGAVATGAVEGEEEGAAAAPRIHGYITPFRPDWFGGLDPVTGNVL
jgi:hypothetical protein